MTMRATATSEYLNRPVRTMEQAKADIEAKRAHMKAAAEYLARRMAAKQDRRT